MDQTIDYTFQYSPEVKTIYISSLIFENNVYPLNDKICRISCPFCPFSYYIKKNQKNNLRFYVPINYSTLNIIFTIYDKNYQVLRTRNENNLQMFSIIAKNKLPTLQELVTASMTDKELLSAPHIPLPNTIFDTDHLYFCNIYVKFKLDYFGLISYIFERDL